MSHDPNLKYKGPKMSIPLDNISKGLFLDIYEKSDVKKTIFEKFDANEYNQSSIQVLEGEKYEIELKTSTDEIELTPKYIFTKQQNIVIPRSSNRSLATLTPNYYVGTLTITIFKSDDLELKVGEVQIEVRSIKLDYFDDYKLMLDDIASRCIDLLLQVDSPVTQSFESDLHQIDERAIYQRFIFVKSMIDSKEFEEAVQKIISNPSTKWEHEIEEKDIRNNKRFTSRNIREIVSRPNRVELSNKIGNLSSVPLKISSSRKVESVDTPENRFIKHAIDTFLNFSEECERLLIKYPNETKDAHRVVEKLNNILNQSFFNKISRPNSLKINSPVLQRRSGYREILNSWLRFDLAAKFLWKGGDDIYSGGKKNIAALYEYWLFFVLLDIIKTQFNVVTDDNENSVVNSLIRPDKNGLGLNLVSGKQTSLYGDYQMKNRKYNVCFSFNKTFRSSLDYKDKKQGSWTIPFRPDYTLSIWPFGQKAEEAEETESIVHIHFDSKYKVELKGFRKIDDTEKVNNENSDEEKDKLEKTLNDEKELERDDTFKNADLWKMHAYKDAIRRTGGAYILYPGKSNDSPQFKGFHEILPGLGAFAIMPSENKENNSSDYSELVKFINELIEHFDDRLTQRERLTTNIDRIFDQKPLDLKSNLKIPEFIDLSLKKKLIPSETFILVGYYRSLNHKNWIIENTKYNIRIGDKNKILTKEMIGASYLLLYTDNSDDCIFYKIISTAPLIYTKQDLKDKMYHTKVSEPTRENYLIYEIEKGNAIELDRLKISKQVIKNYKSDFIGNKTNASPFAMSFEDLLKCLKDV
jgi:predicted component of viral defense system (DUF524 family)